jgi:hypothetical protein
MLSHRLQRRRDHRQHRPHGEDQDDSKDGELRQIMRSRPVDISFLEEARDALSHRSSSFHVINRPQSKGGLKYFIRLGAIGFAYCGGFFCSSSIVPRQFEAPQ